MAAIIKSVATSVSDNPLWHTGALRLADQALGESLRRADREAADIGLLVNAGIYREKNLGEPALASMIQEDVGANPSPRLGHPDHGTFSFDIDNGGSGVLTALELVDGFLGSRTIELGAVVASDSDPGNAPIFPFPSVGGAVLLGPGTPETGFLGFSFETFPEYMDRFQAHIVWHHREHHLPFTPDGKNLLELTESLDFAARAVECSSSALRRFLDSHAIGPGDIDLLVASAYPPTFATSLAEALGVPEDRVATPEEELAGAHTAGIIAALEPALRTGRFAAARTIVFATVGAGIIVGAALYRH